MRDRASLVLELISNPKMVSALQQELLSHAERSEKPLAIVCKTDVLAALKLFEKGRVHADEIQLWASALGGIADIGFEFGAEGVVEESLFWLAFPELNGALDMALCQRIVALYERRSVCRDKF